MRTSRISRDTTRIVNALSPSRRRSSRNAKRDLNNGGEAFKNRLEKRDNTETDAKEITSRPDDVSDPTTSLLGKRKRGVMDASPESLLSPVRQLPRKGDPNTATPYPRKPRRQPAKHIKGPNGTVSVQPPQNWEQIYNATADMRKRVLAPVDTMGCESLAETYRSPKDQRLQTLVSLMLSSQTKDTVTAVAIKNLQENLHGGLCLDSLLRVQPEELNKLIEKVGFHNNKTKYIKSVATILHEQYDDDIPDTIEGLVSLPGVGPKMAYLCMSAAWGRDEGIGVDVHVHRITNLWGWHKTSTPEQTRAELESWLPKEKWHDINNLLVGLGQTICLPVGRKCVECDLAAGGLCPSAEVKKALPVKKVKSEIEIKVENGENEAVRSNEVLAQADDVGVKVEADLAEEGKVETQALAGA